jgi:hypothetical protein
MATDPQAAQITHAEGCSAWGPGHYQCAQNAIARLTAEVATLTALVDQQGNENARLMIVIVDRNREVAELKAALRELSDALLEQCPAMFVNEDDGSEGAPLSLRVIIAADVARRLSADAPAVAHGKGE